MNNLKRHILIVDSEPEWIKFSKSTLEQVGHVVETVGNARDASRFMKRENFDLILVNLKQAEEERDIIRSFAEYGYNGRMVVVMVSTQLSLSNMRTCFNSLRARDCIDKPFNRDELIEVVERELGERQSSADLKHGN